MKRSPILPQRISPVAVLAFAASILAGERPYELVWSNRTRDDHPPLIAFTDTAGWRVEAADATARFERSDDVLLFGDGVAKLTYRATGPNPRVTLFPPAPVAVTAAFDAVTCWIYGNNHSYAPDPKTPPVTVTLSFAGSTGRAFPVTLAHVHFKEWFLCHRRLDADQRALVSQGASLLSITVTGGRNTEDRVIYLNSLAVFTETFAPLAFTPRPQRGVRIFPECSPGLNTGPGILPFPDTPLTIIPRDSAPSVTRVAKSSSGRFLLVRDGEDGRLEVRLPSRAGAWDDLAMRWADAGSDWIPVCIGGGLYLAPETPGAAPRRAAEENIAVSTDGKRVTYAGRLTDGGRTSNVTLCCHLYGKSLILDIQADGGAIAECRFGAARGFDNPRPVPLPYYTYNGYGDVLARPMAIVSGPPDNPLFFMAHIDWTQSNATEPFAETIGLDDAVASNGGTRYRPKTDGARNPCFERFVLTLSPKLEDVLPNIPNPPSPWKHVTGTRVWRAHGASDRARDAAYWRGVRRWGISQLVVTDHETGWRDGNESFTFRTEPAPKKDGVKGQYDYARIMQDELGFVYGPYNNFTDFAPVNGFWNIDLISRTADNQLQHAWERCYAPKPARAVEFCERLAPLIEKKFGFRTAYCDVHTAVTPWSRVDYDARVPGAGTFAAVFYAYGEIMLLQKAAWGGPVYSEGNNHFPYCGLTDGNYAQDQAYRFNGNPWLVDFDLRRMHDLCCNFGMGNLDMFYPGKSAPADPDAARDRFLAATVAFGHPGFLLHGREGELRSYFMLQALASLYTQASADTIGYVDAQGVIRNTSDAVARGVHARSQVVTEYADGTITAANGSPTARLRTEIGDTTIDLPPNGYWGRGANGAVRVFSGDLDGRRADLSVCPAYTYVDGRGRFARFPEGASDGVAILLAITNGLAEILLHKTGEAGFPITIAEAVALSEDNRELGSAEVRTARGLSYIQPVKNAFSYRVRHTYTPPASPLTCPSSELPPGERVTVRGSTEHEVAVPTDAKPGTRLWRTFENAWIDFTVCEPARLAATVETDTLVVRPISRCLSSRHAQLVCGGVAHPFTLEPGTNAPQRLPLPPSALQTGAVAVALHLADAVAAVEITLTRHVADHAIPLPANRAAGMCLRGKPETAIDSAATGAQLHNASSICGGETKAKALFMHPPYRDGVGYTFARYALALPERPLVLRGAVGKQDGSDPGDGILFRVLVEDAAGARTEVANRTVTAHAWHAFEAALAPWAGQHVRLLLVTDVGAKDNSSGDWGVWADLRLEPPEPSYIWR